MLFIIYLFFLKKTKLRTHCLLFVLCLHTQLSLTSNMSKLRRRATAYDDVVDGVVMPATTGDVLLSASSLRDTRASPSKAARVDLNAKATPSSGSNARSGVSSPRSRPSTSAPTPDPAGEWAWVASALLCSVCVCCVIFCVSCDSKLVSSPPTTTKMITTT